MALVVEDGTGKVDATSYVSVTAARAYAAARGLTLPTADAAVEVLLTKALDYIEGLRAEFQGYKTTEAQALQFPRVGVKVDGYAVGSDEIPSVLPMAQARLAVDASTTDLQPNQDGKEIVSAAVSGAVSVTYAQSGNTNKQPIFEAARKLLAPLLRSGSTTGSPFTTVRV